jgi:cytochrome c
MRLLAASLAMMLMAAPSARAGGDAGRGEEIYQRCLACHSLAQNRVGPRHCGLFGRKAGSVKNYQYSTAMKKYGVTWNEATLDHFIENPMGVVPGTKIRRSATDAGPHSSKIATARVQPADAPRILWGKQQIVKPSPGNASRLCSFSR